MRPNTVTFDLTLSSPRIGDNKISQIRSAVSSRARAQQFPTMNNSAPDSLLGFFSTVVYRGEAPIGNVRLRVVPPHWSQVQFPPVPTSQVQFQPGSPEFNEESNRRTRVRGESARAAFASGIRIAYLSPGTSPSSYSPLPILLAIAPDGVWFKLEEVDAAEDEDERKSDASDERNKELKQLYLSCVKESKTAVVGMDNGKTELHLVPVPGDTGDKCRFWAIAAPHGLFTISTALLNRRTLGIVLDLDETLIVANTAKSFETRIEAVKHQIDKHRIPMPNRGMDVQKIATLTAEQKRYEEDRAMLRQFVDSDTVMYNGQLLSAQPEQVSGEMFRPVVRIPGSDIILTRINPEVKDTSVLVRHRPAWNELASYLNENGRKRFEVYVCTMSEKEYALEMLRLLDPKQELISSDRVVCVKAAGKKSLSMFHCHPKMAIVIDDRTDVWDERDRANIYVVPPFSPYYAPNAESNLPLRSARHTVSHSRNKFFRDFGGFVGKLKNLTYESETTTLPPSPSVASYLTFEAGSELADTNGNGPRPFPDGIAGAEVRQALSHSSDDGSLQPGARTKAAGGWLEAEEEEDNDSESPTARAQKDQENEAESKAASVAQEAEAAKWLKFGDPIIGLQEVGIYSMSEVEYRCGIREKEVQQFAAEVMFAGKKIGQGYGKSHKEAKARAAQQGLRALAGRFAPEETPEEPENLPAFNAIAALGDVCAMEGLKLAFRDESTSKGPFLYEVEVDGRIVGRGSGPDEDNAKQRAAEQALRELGNSSRDARENKRPASSRDRDTKGEPEKRHKGNSYKRYSPPPSKKGYSRSRSLPSRR